MINICGEQAKLKRKNIKRKINKTKVSEAKVVTYCVVLALEFEATMKNGYFKTF